MLTVKVRSVSTPAGTRMLVNVSSRWLPHAMRARPKFLPGKVITDAAVG